MRDLLFFLLILIVGAGCKKDNDNSTDLTDKTGKTEFHGCFCGESAYRYLIVLYENNDTIRFNPVNLPEQYKDMNTAYKVQFSATLLDDSTVVYTNLPNDALIEDFKVRNIKLTEIRTLQD